MRHQDKYKHAGRSMTLADGTHILIMDWYDRIVRRSWMFNKGDKRAFNYAVRAASMHKPYDDRVLLVRDLGTQAEFLIHTSEVTV